MFKSIFTKYFAVVSLIVFVSFLVMGAVQTAMASSMLLDEKQKLMTENAERVAASAAEDFRLSPTDESRYVLDTDRSRLTVTVPLLSAAIDADILITDAEGGLLAASVSGNSVPHSVPEAELRRASATASAFFIGTLGGLYTERQYIVTAPIQRNDTLVGYVVVASSANYLIDRLLDNLRTYFLSALCVLLCAFVVIYISTVQLVRPLKNMSEAVRRFGEGDFSYRIPVKGRDEVAQLASSLNAMASSLSAAEDTSRSFVANVSHELKTPMTTIGGFIDGILDGTIPPEKQDHYLGIVSDEVKRLSRLVRTMLDLSRIDGGSLRMSPQEMDLTDKTCKTLLSFEQRIEEKQIRIEGLDSCEPCVITADSDLIGQVLYNLMDNAVKFTDEGGTISFSVKKTEKWAECTIRNTGKGIPPEELPHIFERFYKSDKSRSMDKTGAGLGLFIVHNIIHLHGGNIYVRSAENEFCEFMFRLPCKTGENIYEKHEKSSKKGHI